MRVCYTISVYKIMFEIITLVILILSIVIHEVSHGYAANWLGDPTARLAGRLSPNPFLHIDPVGSVLVPAVLYITNAHFLLIRIISVTSGGGKLLLRVQVHFPIYSLLASLRYSFDFQSLLISLPISQKCLGMSFSSIFCLLFSTPFLFHLLMVRRLSHHSYRLGLHRNTALLQHIWRT